jgi:uncharacterized protein (DUF433 family)
MNLVKPRFTFHQQCRDIVVMALYTVKEHMARKAKPIKVVVTAAVHSDPEILGGTPVFRGTRVPFKTLMNYLESGRSLADFLIGFSFRHTQTSSGRFKRCQGSAP